MKWLPLVLVISLLPAFGATRLSPLLVGHRIGERYGGGIIFYVDSDGQHGLVASLADQNPGVPWYNGITRYTGVSGDGTGVGATNTELIISKLRQDDEKGI